jgi:hypothetical protein
MLTVRMRPSLVNPPLIGCLGAALLLFPLSLLLLPSAALPHMTAVLQGRPASFPSLEVACDWAVSSGTCKNKEMAGVSLPAQLTQVRY